MAISMFLDSIYLNWVQRRFQNATPEARSLLRAARVSLSNEAADAPTAGGPLNAYLARNPVLQLLQNNHSWLALLSNSTAIGAGADGDDYAVRVSNASRAGSYYDHGLTALYPYLAVAMAVSLMFLALICVAYCVLPDLRSTHGKNLLSLSGCFIVLYVGLIVDFTLRSVLPRRMCLAVAVVQHTSFLAVFFWTNVMAFDVTPAYAWTATAAVSAPAFVLHFTELVPQAYRPRFGEVRCWLSGQLAYALYFNLPVGIILLCNVVIFGLTAWALYRAKTLQRVTLQAKQHKKMFYLYVKLSVVMGIIWVFEFIPWITGYYRLYGLAGMLNSLHGIYLFFIFVFKRKTLAQLRQRLSCCGKRTVKPTLSKKFSSSTLTVCLQLCPEFGALVLLPMVCTKDAAFPVVQSCAFYFF
ncbi:hypothetical protein HPB50_012418 [Hyalomma asiaticum]|uniref:Uncharacterized protein n=1 Tax=Hyalomma asiaticum TaxID=266040 RepID=A0ACB7SXW1_HYAAI|nr:hypothetical protein HPB50_012418 [Hyalomma asiaticum]